MYSGEDDEYNEELVSKASLAPAIEVFKDTVLDQTIKWVIIQCDKLA